MFNLLSNQTKLLALLSRYSTEELASVNNNLKLTIKLLSHNVTLLLKNRRIHGVLLPQVDKLILNLSDKEIQALSCEQILLTQEYLINTINSFCLTEAVIVRDNFSNCLAFIAEEGFSVTPAIMEKNDKRENTIPLEKNNVSPIRLTEIKQRLAHAIQTPENKQQRIKSRLNNLLIDPSANKIAVISKQA
jgi:hypothetical protein